MNYRTEEKSMGSIVNKIMTLCLVASTALTARAQNQASDENLLSVTCAGLGKDRKVERILYLSQFPKPSDSSYKLACFAYSPQSGELVYWQKTAIRYVNGAYVPSGKPDKTIHAQDSTLMIDIAALTKIGESICSPNCPNPTRWPGLLDHEHIFLKKPEELKTVTSVMQQLANR
jgi:hypothetical protein